TWASSRPWTSALEDKHVLVVYPLADQIQSQYAHRNRIFPSNNVLPRLGSLTCIKAEQSAAGSKSRFATWFDALEYMKEEMNKQHYDVALIGAGAYGLPLAAHAKRSKAIGIHMGGL